LLREYLILSRGGQGGVTESRILATATTLEGRWAQAIPEFGAERRGAIVKAYLRVSDKRFPDHGVSVAWVGPWPGLICFTQASWGPVEPNATGLPSETLLKSPGSSQRNPCRGIPSEDSQVAEGGILGLTPRPK